MSNTVRQQLKYPLDPVSQSILEDYLNSRSSSSMPIGSVSAFAGSAAPTGYLLCDGAAVSRSDYSALYAVTGDAYGAGDGSTTFNLPNLQGKVIAGYSAEEAEFDTLGETGGEKTHTLTVNEIPSHQHPTMGAEHQVSSASTNPGGGTQNIPNSEYFTGYSGGGLAHNNLQPYLTLNYIIKY